MKKTTGGMAGVGWLRSGVAFCLAAVMTVAGAGAAWAEDRIRIEEVNLYISSTIEAGSSSGTVHVTTSDSTYRAGGVEILNDDDDWVGGMTPRVSVELYAASGYYFAGTGKNMFSFSGDDATYVTARREDDKTTLALTFKLDKLDNGDLSVSGAEWDESSGTATWNENPGARYYQVKLYRDESTVASTRTTRETYYDFAGNITRRGDYYFMVRAVGSGSEKGDWESSDSWYVTSREAEDLSDGYSSDGPGGSSSYGSSGGPGVNGSGNSSGGPGASGSGNNGGGPGGSSGGPGASGSGTGYSTARGHHWCLDQKGWWFQYSGGGYPQNCWELIDGKWYCFGQDGYIRCGWIDWNGRWYYTDAGGAMLVNARTPDGYYVGGDGGWIS